MVFYFNIYKCFTFINAEIIMKIKNYFLATFVIAIMFGCSKDSVSTKSMMTYDGKDYDLSTGVIENYGYDNSTKAYQLDLTLISSGLKLKEVNGEIDGVTGSGEAIYIEAYSSKADGFAVGKYSFGYDEKPNTFDYGEAYFNFNATTSSGTTVEIDGGEMTVSKRDGNSYEISFSFTTEDGKKLTGTYKGDLKYFEY